LAELLPVGSIWSIRYVYDNKIWWELASSDGGTIYYNEPTNVIIQKQEMAAPTKPVVSAASTYTLCA